LGAVRASPLGFTSKASEAQAVIVHLAGAVIGAVVLAKTAHAVPLSVPSHFAPTLFVVTGRGGGNVRGGISWFGTGGLTGGGSWLRDGRGRGHERRSLCTGNRQNAGEKENGNEHISLAKIR